MLGAPPIKDLQKLERYREESALLWQDEPACDCEPCPAAIIAHETLEKDFDLRLHLFAPEIKARMK